MTTVIVVVIVTASGAGALNNDQVVETGADLPQEQSVGQPSSEQPPPSGPAPEEPAPAPEHSPPASAPAPASDGGVSSGSTAGGLGSVANTREPGDLSPAGEEPAAVGAPPRPFQIVTPARPASSQSIPAIPTGEPFGIVLAAAVLLLVGAATGHAWAQATGRLDSLA